MASTCIRTPLAPAHPTIATRAGLVLGLALLLAPPASALPTSGPPSDPSLLIQWTDEDGSSSESSVALQLDKTGKGFGLANPGRVVAFGEDTITLEDASGIFDPVLNFAIAAQDNGTPSSFAASLVSPLVPTLFGNTTYSIFLVGGFTDGASNGGSLAPFGTSFGTMDVSLNGSAVDGVGSAAIFPTPGANYGAFSKSGVFDCGGGGCTTFDIGFGFTGSGGGDAYTLNGRFEVPAPPTLALLGSGLVGLAVAGRRRAD